MRLAGEGLNSSAANRFGAILFKSDSREAYDWHWETRPKYNAKRKDGTVEFSILGKHGARKKRAKKSKRKGDTKPSAD